MRTRLRFVLAAMLALTSMMAPALAQDDAGRVTGAGEAIFPADTTFNGVQLRGLTLGQGLFIHADGSALGQFQAVLLGTSLLGLPQEIAVEGDVTTASLSGDGSVSFSGTATVEMGDGTVPLLEVPFWVTASTTSLGLTLSGTQLPTATLSAGSITIE